MLPTGGFSIDGIFSKEWNNFISGFGINEEYSTFGSVLSPHNTLRFLLDIRLFLPLIKDVFAGYDCSTNPTLPCGKNQGEAWLQARAQARWGHEVRAQREEFLLFIGE